MSLNKVMLIGNVGKDPEVRYLDNLSNPNAGNTKVATTLYYRTLSRRNGELRKTRMAQHRRLENSADVVGNLLKGHATIHRRQVADAFLDGPERTETLHD